MSEKFLKEIKFPINSSELKISSTFLSDNEIPKIFIKIINTLKTNKMDYNISISLYLYRIKFLLEKNKKKKFERKSTIFDSYYLHKQDIDKTIEKIFNIFNVDGQIIILSLYLLEKIIIKNKIILDEINLLKIVVISLIETIKFNVDNYDTDGKLICSILRIKKDMLINLELEFLGFIDYRLKVDEDKFFKYKQKIMILWIDYLKDSL